MKAGIPFTTYIPKKDGGQKLIDDLVKIAKAQDRSVNYMIVLAIRQLVEEENGG